MTDLVHAESPMDFFKGLIEEAMSHQQVESSSDSADYLVQLLDSFVRPDHVYARLELEPESTLAEIFCSALTAAGMRRFELLKFSGDMSLLVSGVFSDSLVRKLVDVDYYAKLGGTAYSTVAVSCHSPASAALFEELAAKFIPFVDVLNEVAESCSLSDRSNLLRLYERFLLTGSRRCAEILSRHGVDLMPGAFGEVH